MNNILLTSVLTSAIALSTSIFSNAQKSAPLQTSYFHQSRNDNGNGSKGSVAVDRLGMRGGVPLILEEDNLLALGFRYSLNDYNFRNTVADWGAIHQVDVGLASRWQYNDDWLFANYAVAGVSVEEGAAFEKGLNFNLISVAEYEVSKRFKIGPGFVLSAQVDQNLQVIPILAIEWQISDEWKFASGPSDVAAAGANVYFEYTPSMLNEKWVFTTGFSYGSQNFKIEDNALVIDGSGEERLASAYLAASYKMNSGLKFSAIAGYNFFQSYSIYSDGGRELSKENLEDAPYFGIAVGYEF